MVCVSGYTQQLAACVFLAYKMSTEVSLCVEPMLAAEHSASQQMDAAEHSTSEQMTTETTTETSASHQSHTEHILLPKRKVKPAWKG